MLTMIQQLIIVIVGYHNKVDDKNIQRLQITEKIIDIINKENLGKSYSSTISTAIKSLIKKKLIIKHSTRFRLTDEGIEKGREILSFIKKSEKSESISFDNIRNWYINNKQSKTGVNILEHLKHDDILLKESLDKRKTPKYSLYKELLLKTDSFTKVGSSYGIRIFAIDKNKYDLSVGDSISMTIVSPIHLRRHIIRLPFKKLIMSGDNLFYTIPSWAIKKDKFRKNWRIKSLCTKNLPISVTVTKRYFIYKDEIPEGKYAVVTDKEVILIDKRDWISVMARLKMSV